MNFNVIGFFIAEWAVCTLIGYGLVNLFLPSRWSQERLLLMPVFGAGGIILLSSFLSYAGLGMRTGAPLIVVIGVGLSAAVCIFNWETKRSLSGWSAAIYVNILGFISGLAALASLLLYNAWDPYNDTFTYVSIADYLLDKSFFTPADPGAYHPVLTQMLLYQRFGLRMGSNFLLSFFAGIFGFEYSFDAYMPTLALGLWLAIPGFWFFCRRYLFLSIPAGSIAAVFYSLNFSIPIANALFGFMPQTWGMVFFLPALSLFTRSTTHLERSRMLASAGLMGSLLLLTYTEILPFAFSAIFFSFFYRIGFGKLRLKDALISLIFPIPVIILLAPVSAWKFPTAMITQISAVVGWDMKFGISDYLAMMAGFRSFLQGKASPILFLVSILTALAVLYAFFFGPARNRRQVVPMSLIFLMVLAYFSLFVKNPWNPDERGQPWSTYKTGTYLFFLFASMYGLGIYMLWRKRRLFRVGATILIAIYIFLFPNITLKVARSNATAMRKFTGVIQNPVAEYKRIRQLFSDLPTETPINLLFSPEALRHRQITAYFLRRPVIASWMDDPYISHWLLPQYRSLQIDFSFPILAYEPLNPKRSFANLVRDPDLVIFMGSGWHVWEHYENNRWRWLEKEGEFLIFLRKESRIRLQGEIAIVGAPQRTIRIRLQDRPDFLMQLSMKESQFTPFSPIELDLPSGVSKIFLSADGPVSHMGKDPRNVRLGIRNLSGLVQENGTVVRAH